MLGLLLKGPSVLARPGGGRDEDPGRLVALPSRWHAMAVQVIHRLLSHLSCSAYFPDRRSLRNVPRGPWRVHRDVWSGFDDPFVTGSPDGSRGSQFASDQTTDQLGQFRLCLSRFSPLTDLKRGYAEDFGTCRSSRRGLYQLLGRRVECGGELSRGCTAHGLMSVYDA